MSKIIRGYWNCLSCGRKAIDGLKDECPSCGKRKPDDINYYMVSKDDVVSELELNEAGINEEECDGNHKEWICSYCNQINNYSDDICVSCGGNKNESIYEYGEKEKSEEYELDNSNDILEDVMEKEVVNSSEDDINNNYSDSSNFFNRIKKYLFKYKYFAIAFSILAFLLVLFFPYKETSTVSGFSWERCITIEELKTFDESDWSLPSGARLHYTQEELYGYEQVLDHYDTKTRQCSREVQDGYDIYYTYQDNGNGTFTEVEHSTPKYRTEYYTEEYQEPVYRDEPIYKTKYYYEIDIWIAVDYYKSSGQDKNPWWNDDYSLKEKQIDIFSENYYIHFVNSKNKEYKDSVNISQWENVSTGDSMTVKRCLVCVYSSEKNY